MVANEYCGWDNWETAFVYKLERMSCPICECEVKVDNNSENGRLFYSLPCHIWPSWGLVLLMNYAGGSPTDLGLAKVRIPPI